MTTNPFETSDITLAAYLKIQSVPLIEIKKDGRRSIFVFDLSLPEHAKLVQKFDLGETSVEPVNFIGVRQQLINATAR